MRDRTEELANKIGTMVLVMINAHDLCANTPENRVRKPDGLPYGVHPAFTTFLMLHEMGIPVEQRIIYAEALNFHDLKEDTNASTLLIGKEARALVDLLTFPDGVDTAEEALKRGMEVAMLKSFDTVGNLFGLDLVDWPLEKKLKRLTKAIKLFEAVKPHYPDLYLWCIADGLVSLIETRLGVAAQW